jgi:hypothetical protein
MQGLSRDTNTSKVTGQLYEPCTQVEYLGEPEW